MPRPDVRVLGILVAAALVAGGPSRAEGPGREGNGPCRAEIEKHCADVERGGGATGRCLREHHKELSPACRDHLAGRHAQRKERAQAVSAACKSELAQHCADHEPGEGGLIRCLRDHEADLSKECRAALPERRRP
jgi:hypothetical protein